MKYHRTFLPTIISLLLVVLLCSCNIMTSFIGSSNNSDQFQNPDADHKLYLALKSRQGYGNWALLEEAIEEGAYLDGFIRDYWSKGRGEGTLKTPLHMSLYRGHTRMAICLLEHGADPNVVDVEMTPLMYLSSAHAYFYPAFEALIDHGADLTIKDSQGNNVWDHLFEFIEDPQLTVKKINKLIASDRTSLRSKEITYILDTYCLPVSLAKEMLDILRDEKINIDVDKSIIAALDGESETVKNAILKSTIDNRQHLLRAASRFCDYQIFADLKLSQDELNYLLYNAAQGGNVELIQLLIDRGAQVDYTIGDLCPTPVMAAVTYEQHEALKALLDNGASITMLYNPHDHAVLGAARNGDTVTIDMLEEYGIEYRELTVYYAMQEAVRFDQPIIIQYFVNKGWPVQGYKESPIDDLLHDAAFYNNNNIFHMLIEAGSDPTIYDDGGNDSWIMTTAIEAGNLDIVQTLHQLGMDINGYKENSNYGTYLNDAIAFGWYDIVEYLLDAGVDINEEYSVLKACHQSTRIFQLLIERGIDINVINPDDGASVLLTAISGPYQNIELLLQAGADTSAVDSKGHDVIYYVEKYATSKDKVMEILEKYGVAS